MKEYIKLIRAKHWLKNGLVFLPLFFSINLFNTSYYLGTILAFIVFSFTASIVYIINDMGDIEKDRLHPVKKKRPLAAGTISVKNAKIVNLNEEYEQDADLNNITVKPYQILTIEVEK